MATPYQKSSETSAVYDGANMEVYRSDFGRKFEEVFPNLKKT